MALNRKYELMFVTEFNLILKKWLILIYNSPN